MLKGKKIVVGVTGGIAAYKVANLVSCLVKAHADVHVVMTHAATQFITPLVMQTLSGNPCYTDCADERLVGMSVHVSIADGADAFIIAPATANSIAKCAYGIADDVVSTTMLAMTCPVFISPAMNTHMYENAAVQENLSVLKRRGCIIIPPDEGRLACGTVGEGKFPPESVILSYVYREIACIHDLEGMHVVVTAGPTQEAIDPVRYITNHSSGKMGYALAYRAMLRGAHVTLITGPCSINPPAFVDVIQVVSAHDMFEAVKEALPGADALFMAAAVADFTPVDVAQDKIKKTSDTPFSMLALTSTQDILSYVGEHRLPHQRICGFSMETNDVLTNSQAKLARKKVDMIAANSLRESGAGFGTDTNHLTCITADSVCDIPLTTKECAADALITALFSLELTQG